MNPDNLNDELLDEGVPHTGTLPQFLNVLTILTFVGSGLTFIMAVYNLLTVEQQREQLEETRRLLGDSSMIFGSDIVKSAEMALEHNGSIQGSAIAAAILCLIGAWLMRQLKKNGFYLYVLGCVVATVVPIVIMGTGFMGGFPILIGLVFTLAFVIMYGVNFKYLK